MAEPADTVCIVIGIITITGPSFSFNTVLSGFPPLLQNVLNLFLRLCVRVLPEMNNFISDSTFNKLTVLVDPGSHHSYPLLQGQCLGDELAL